MAGCGVSKLGIDLLHLQLEVEKMPVRLGVTFSNEHSVPCFGATPCVGQLLARFTVAYSRREFRQTVGVVLK